MDLNLPELPPTFLELLMKHGQTLAMRVTSWELGQVTLTRKATGETFVKRALGIAGNDLLRPDRALSYRVVYQQVIDSLLPTLQASQGALVNVRLSAFGFRNRVTFVVEVG